MKNRVCFAIFAIITVGFTAFIFSNSLQVAEESTQSSDYFVSAITALLDRLGGFVDYDTLSFIVRKIGHFAEYTILALLASATIYFGFNKNVYLVFSPIYCLLTAIVDEFVCQRITEGRSPEWRDILIDSTGAILGTVAVLLLIILLKKRSRKGEKV